MKMSSIARLALELSENDIQVDVNLQNKVYYYFMSSRIFIDNLSTGEFPENSILDISAGGKVLIISDLHMG